MDKRPIGLIHTPCKMCVFAKYENNTQVSCESGFLDNHKKRGYEILEVYDSEKEFFVINNRKCLGFRDQEWLSKQAEKNIDDLKDKIKTENQLKYIAILKIEPKTILEDIKKIIISLSEQCIVPQGIIFYKNKWGHYSITNETLLKFMSKFPLKWKIKNFIDRSLTDDQKLKLTFAECPLTRFFLIIDLKSPLPNNCISNIQNYINSGGSFGCIDINNNLFFSFMTMHYCENIKKIDLLTDKSIQTKYETIS